MYKNQLQELAQRSCFNLPSYACIREGPDHAPRFRASVNFNGEIFESSSYSTTLRQAEHAAAEIALNVLSTRGPSRSLTARILDETGIYKNLLQETAHRAGLKLPLYTTVRSGPGHIPIFTCNVELAGMNFRGEPAKTKKQAEKNAAISAWTTLKKMPSMDSMSKKESGSCEEQDQVIVAKVLSNFREKDEAKQCFRREQIYKARGKMVKGHSSSSSTFVDSMQNQKNLLDLLMETLSESSTPKQNYVSLVPPPPPRTSSKILPPPISSKERSLVPIEEHQRDEEEWLSGKSDFRPQIKNRQIGSSNSSPKAPLNYIGRFNPHRFAPAVQIRSVIPVRAAPPSIKPIKEQTLQSSPIGPSKTASEITSQPNSKFIKIKSTKEESLQSSSNGSSTTVPEISSSSSKFIINPLTSQFNNKLQL